MKNSVLIAACLFLSSCSIISSSDGSRCGDTFRYKIDGNAKNMTVTGFINGKEVVSASKVDAPWQSKEVPIGEDDLIEINVTYPEGPGRMYIYLEADNGRGFGISHTDGNAWVDGRDVDLSYPVHETYFDFICKENSQS